MAKEFDRRIHITTEQLADLMGVDASELAGGVKKYGGPRSLFRATVNGRQQSVYCRFAAVGWVDEQRTSKRMAERGRRVKVPPREIRPLHQQGEYRPSPALRSNFARAGELYQHRLYTPACIGNGRQFAADFERGR